MICCHFCSKCCKLHHLFNSVSVQTLFVLGRFMASYLEIYRYSPLWHSVRFESKSRSKIYINDSWLHPFSSRKCGSSSRFENPTATLNMLTNLCLTDMQWCEEALGQDGVITVVVRLLLWKYILFMSSIHQCSCRICISLHWPLLEKSLLAILFLALGEKKSSLPYNHLTCIISV